MNNVRELVRDAVALGVALANEQQGVTSGELSQRQARKVYGKYFADLVAFGRIRPVHTEQGHAGTKFFRVADILRCKVEDSAEATILNTHTL